MSYDDRCFCEVVDILVDGVFCEVVTYESLAVVLEYVIVVEVGAFFSVGFAECCVFDDYEEDFKCLWWDGEEYVYGVVEEFGEVFGLYVDGVDDGAEDFACLLAVYFPVWVFFLPESRHCLPYFVQRYGFCLE